MGSPDRNAAGFIKPDDGGDDLFCHVSQITDGNALSEGATVHFVKVFDERRCRFSHDEGGGGGGYGGGGGRAARYGGGGGRLYGGGGGGVRRRGGGDDDRDRGYGGGGRY
ncbi:cold shock protein [Aureococcus anophagefferens]|uniref:Cold shock protein n=1 Tax=Aureococcus anophagefferens TaxID=44056 RepID=A0ABR1FSE2_AURAN